MPAQSKMRCGSSAASACLALAGTAGAIALTSQSPSSFVTAPASVSSHGQSNLAGATDVDRPALRSVSSTYGASSIAAASATAGAIAALAGMSRMNQRRGRISKGDEVRTARKAKKAGARDGQAISMCCADMRNKEINKGRLALISTLGIFAAEVATGQNASEQLALSATQFDPAAQIGAVEPLGYFDPLGFTKVGDEEGFNKLRAAEIKHGRVAMMASIGAVAQPLLKLPVFDSPDATGTFGALADERVALGFLGLFVVSGMMELRLRDQGREPGNFGDPVGFDMYNDDMRNKEINNGRMAMISILGIFAAEFETGKNAIEQLTLFAEAS